ncbi:aspartyl-phosphate phosphatase Spo0E family protein [Bhargavaea beijingensis]|uniref:Aspartyl-phosphate phosphatase Spo0E family protein n=2 Tax=Bhargavaea beijingensis TaxID=426756 RepID=A0ABX9ZCY5_9BACL|nr:aspartyl-phosphate phosphatase Spo0E family protein [Bhargavaea beijingensis]RSK31018.1 aspartyl-phosphate phosphatase Spo0E family protein [Bhargavaea beijingensis]
MNMDVSKKILKNRIYCRRKIMYWKARQFGLTHPKTVECSQILDNLLNRYQKFDQHVS